MPVDEALLRILDLEIVRSGIRDARADLHLLSHDVLPGSAARATRRRETHTQCGRTGRIGASDTVSHAPVTGGTGAASEHRAVWMMTQSRQPAERLDP
ncbi:hypothetical protein GCM10009847_02850 [Leucobacter tardus]